MQEDVQCHQPSIKIFNLQIIRRNIALRSLLGLNYEIFTFGHFIGIFSQVLGNKSADQKNGNLFGAITNLRIYSILTEGDFMKKSTKKFISCLIFALTSGVVAAQNSGVTRTSPAPSSEHTSPTSGAPVKAGAPGLGVKPGPGVGPSGPGPRGNEKTTAPKGSPETVVEPAIRWCGSPPHQCK